MAKYGLGKGLGALIPDALVDEARKAEGAGDGFAAPGASATGMVPSIGSGASTGSGGILMAAVASLSPNADQPRKSFDDGSIAELASSIARHGIIQPLVVEPDGSGEFRIVAGERRWRAAKAAGLAEVPVIVKEYGREKRLEIALVENVQREDLNPIDEAEAYRQLMEATALTQDQVAERVGKSRPAVANALRLLGLPAEAKEALRSGSISAGHARAVLSAADPADRKALLRRAIDDGISVREAEAMAAAFNRGDRSGALHAGASGVGSRAGKSAGSEPARLDPNLAAVEQYLIGRLGTKVTIKGTPDKGVISVEYFSLDDLERVRGIIAGDGA